MIILYFGGKKTALIYFTACVKSIFKFTIKGVNFQKNVSRTALFNNYILNILEEKKGREGKKGKEEKKEK